MMVKLRQFNSVGDVKCIGEAALVLEMQFLDTLSFFFKYLFVSAAVFLAKPSLYCHNCYGQIVIFTKSICRYIMNSFMRINFKDGVMNKLCRRNTNMGSVSPGIINP